MRRESGAAMGVGADHAAIGDDAGCGLAFEIWMTVWRRHYVDKRAKY
jgi:hypothetical protein